MNHSYLNSYTASFAASVFTRILPFTLSLPLLSTDFSILLLFVFILYISLAGTYIGYSLGHSIYFKKAVINPQIYARKRYDSYLLFCTAVMIMAFILLGISGIGVHEWIFNNRYAYINGRAGNGIWYILFQINIIMVAVFTLCLANKKKNKLYYFLYLIPLIASFFTGSKGFMLGVIILFILFFDCFEKRIKFIHLAIAGVIGLVLIILLLYVQSGISLAAYSDYYTNFLNYLSYFKENDMTHTYGQIQFEEIFWNLVPRAFYSDKPYVYGQVRIANIFYPYEALVAGNTPSFSEYVVPYSDFGLIGVFFSFFFGGFFQGLIERAFRDSAKKYGSSFNFVFIYAILFIVTPVNFSIVYLIVFVVIMYILQKLYLFEKPKKKTKLRTLENPVFSESQIDANKVAS